MSDDRHVAAVRRLLELLADHLEATVEGDEGAGDALLEALEAGTFTDDDLHAAILTLRSLASGAVGAVADEPDQLPGKDAQRILSAEERESLSPEAWGFLLALRRRGSLDAEQFERVLGQITTLGIRPVGVDLAREVAARVALRPAEGPEGAEFGHGEINDAH